MKHHIVAGVAVVVLALAPGASLPRAQAPAAAQTPPGAKAPVHAKQVKRLLVKNAMVVLAPDSPQLERRFDLYRTAMANVNGQFRLTAVPPATYRLMAFEFLESDAWQDPQFLKTYQASSTRIRVGEMARQENIRLMAAPVRR